MTWAQEFLPAAPAAQNTSAYMPLLKEKKIALVANQTSVIFKKDGSHVHLADSLLSHGVDLTKVFAPEHGFRGKADAGAHVEDGVDSKTGLPLISLYGKNKKPSEAQLEGIELILFDIQDVGARFYTYISTLHYVMEAAAEHGIEVLVLDRPNPNAHIVDGPMLEAEHQSFVGMHPVPVLYGMTIGEYAQMINGEGWLKDGIKVDLKVIANQNYNHQKPYSLPIKPSPNLPNDQAIALYPSLCFFEGTPISAGRGTEMQFQIYGAPALPLRDFKFEFIPQANEGSQYPKFKGLVCHGEDLRAYQHPKSIDLNYLIKAYDAYPDQENFFNAFFTKLAGTENLEQQIKNHESPEQIRKSWKKDLKSFHKTRAKYLIYP